jgi:hypothetical protein
MAATALCLALAERARLIQKPARTKIDAAISATSEASAATEASGGEANHLVIAHE